MEQKTTGIVISVAKQWWFKVNTKAVRTQPTDGAVFPYIIKVQYTADGNSYTKRKWIGAGRSVPVLGAALTVCYQKDNPQKAKIL